MSVCRVAGVGGLVRVISLKLQGISGPSGGGGGTIVLLCVSSVWLTHGHLQVSNCT